MGIPHETFAIVVAYFSDSFHKNIDLLIEKFQDQDWIGVPHETLSLCSCISSDSFHENIDLFRVISTSYV